MSRRLLAALAVVPALLFAGCGSGQRPALQTTTTILGGSLGQKVGNPAVDAVLVMLEGPASPLLTATYDVERKLGPNRTSASVVRRDGETSITVGPVRFIDGVAPRTCNLQTGACEAGILDQRISDYSVGSAFWSKGPARALRVAYSRRSGEPTAVTRTIGGQPATCVDVPVGGGVEHYCALPSGIVSLWDTAAVHAELTDLSAVADQTAFATGGAPAATTAVPTTRG